MNFDKIIARAKAILLTPKTEWPVIAAEQTTVADLYKNYIVILAALGPVAAFLGMMLFGFKIPFVGTIRPSFGDALTSLILGYAIALGVVFVVALITDALAPTFGGEKNQVQALKAAAYSSTPGWLVGILWILPALAPLLILLAIAAAVYGVYLLYLGLPYVMKTPKERSIGYAIAIIVIGFVLQLAIQSITGIGKHGASDIPNLSMGSSSSSVVGGNDAVAKLDAWSKNVEAAGKQLEAAQKSGDAAAQSKALGAVLGAAAGGQQVEALAPDVLKPFVPETLAGLPRTDFSAERNGALGMQVSEARATYANNGDRRIELEVVDMGSAKGLMSLASWATVENQRETEHGYEKTYQQGGRLVHEQWDGQDKHGEYAVIVGDRFSVKASGHADSIDQLKAAVAAINLSGLEALKNQGVKNG